jgi:hypothetical protein
VRAYTLALGSKPEFRMLLRDVTCELRGIDTPSTPNCDDRGPVGSLI